MKLLKGLKKLAVKKITPTLYNPLMGDKMGEVLEAIVMPEGHIACPKCGNPWWFINTDKELARSRLGCSNCAYEDRINWPKDSPQVAFLGNGEWRCPKHPDAAKAIIRSGDVISVGCQKCQRDIQIKQIGRAHV